MAVWAQEVGPCIRSSVVSRFGPQRDDRFSPYHCRFVPFLGFDSATEPRAYSDTTWDCNSFSTVIYFCGTSTSTPARKHDVQNCGRTRGIPPFERRNMIYDSHESHVIPEITVRHALIHTNHKSFPSSRPRSHRIGAGSINCGMSKGLKRIHFP